MKVSNPLCIINCPSEVIEASSPSASNFLINDPKVSFSVISIFAFSPLTIIASDPSALRVSLPHGLLK